jgi:hypothetical protein
MIKLKSILREIGDGSSKAFPWNYDSSDRGVGDPQDFTYTFKTDKGDYRATFVLAGDNEWDLAFGSMNSNGYLDYNKATGAGAFRVMATIIEITNDFLDNTYEAHIDDKNIHIDNDKLEPKKISFNTKKEEDRSDEDDSRRSNLYKAYIQKQVPKSRVEKTDSGRSSDAYTIHLS